MYKVFNLLPIITALELDKCKSHHRIGQSDACSSLVIFYIYIVTAGINCTFSLNGYDFS